ncbi:hypothetical protein D7V82_21060 [bacterium 1xD8-6]|nr:hypothetical protein D7V72_21690 [bacterium D16-36]RKI63096.1 hypothetical protein D7V82_21060 [bacterium 1xD8-6]
MENLKTIEGKVKSVLQENEDARNDDMVLYLALCNLYLKDAGAMPLAQILLMHGQGALNPVCTFVLLILGYYNNDD